MISSMNVSVVNLENSIWEIEVLYESFRKNASIYKFFIIIFIY